MRNKEIGMTDKKTNRINHTVFIEKYGTPFVKEVVIIIVAAIILLLVSIEIDAFELLVDFVSQHEEYELDEFVMLLLIFSIAFMVIIIRNLKYLKIEINLRVASEEELNKIISFDQLTGLPNRRLCKNRLQQLISKAKINKRLAAVFHIDLDNFKYINDSYGHVLGDELLKQFSQRLLGKLRVDDTLARISGDEFIMIIDSPSNIDCISLIAEKLIVSLKSPFYLEGEEIFTNMSIGVSVYPTDADNVDNLLKYADSAMYRAKLEGKGTYRYYSEELQQQSQYKLKISNSLRKAIENNEFEVHYQPVIDVKTERIKGSEALLRWTNKDLGKVGPDVFIPIAEEIGMMDEIGDWVLNQACRQNEKWRSIGFDQLTIAVNMSAKQLAGSSFVANVKNALAVSKLPARYLEMELTETAVLQDVDSAIKQLQSLKKMGVSVALDDFGTGYSSMSYLVKLKIDRLKIDKSFIDNIPSSIDDVITTKAIISLAKNLNLKVTAEGVETQAQKEFFESTDCDSLQGYFYSRPIPAHEFEVLLKQAVEAEAIAVEMD